MKTLLTALVLTVVLVSTASAYNGQNCSSECTNTAPMGGCYQWHTTCY